MTRLLLATTNRGKQQEFMRLLGGLPEVVVPQDLGLELDVPEPHDTYAENAIAKAEAFARASGLPSLADDSGIETAALGWGPGVRSARFADPTLPHADKLLRALDGAQDRRARMVCALALATPLGDGDVGSEVFTGVMEGRIADSRRGEGGFGYDPIFELPDGRTTAELAPSDKDRVSHRGRAVAVAMPRLRALFGVRVHPTAEVDPGARIGPGTSIWNQAQVRDGARVGAGCVIGKNVYVDAGVVIGDHVKVQNNVSLYRGVTVEDGVFIGPHACFTNDKVPRAINRDGSPKTDADWTVTPTLVRRGASLGANCTILPGVTVGRWAMVAAGAVVTRDVGEAELVAGNPARRIGSACACGQPLRDAEDGAAFAGRCPACGEPFVPPDPRP